MNIADRLKELRKKAGYSQEQLAEMLNISRQAVSKWESAQGNPDIENLIKLTEIYNVSADYILSGQEKDEVPEPPEPNQESPLYHGYYHGNGSKRRSVYRPAQPDHQILIIVMALQ